MRDYYKGLTEEEKQRAKAIVAQSAARSASNTITPVAPKGRGGFLTSLISEGGGLGGATAGASLGASVGSIVPGVGTVLGGLLGAGIGGFAGATGGRLAENKIRDDKYKLGEALKEGAITGVLSASPLKLVKGASAASQALAAGSKGMPAFNAAIAKPGIIAQMLGKAGNRATTASLKASPTQLTKFATETGEDIVPFIQRNNLIGKSADELKNIKPQFQSAYNAAVTGIDRPIQLDEILKAAREGGIGKLAGSSATSSRKMGIQSMDELGAALGRGKKKQFLPEEILGVKRDFDAATKAYRFDDAAKAVPQNVSDTLKDVIRAASPQSRVAGQDVQKLNKLIELASKQENLGRGTMPFGMTDLIAGGAGGAAGGVPGMAAAIAAKRLANSPKLASGFAKYATGAAERGAARALKPSSIGAIAKRTLPFDAAGAMLGALSPDEQAQQEPTGVEQDLTTLPGGGSPDVISALGGAGGVPEPQQSMYSREAAAMDIQKDLQATGGKNMDKYMALYEFMNPEVKADANKPGYGRPSAQQYSLATAGIEGADQLAQMLASDPSVLNKTATPGQDLPIIGGLINRLTGTGEYQATAQNTLDALARARTGAAMTPSEEKFYQRLLPRAGDNQTTVQNKLQLLRSSFQPFMGYGESGGGGDAADILSQLGL